VLQSVAFCCIPCSKRASTVTILVFRCTISVKGLVTIVTRGATRCQTIPIQSRFLRGIENLYRKQIFFGTLLSSNENGWRFRACLDSPQRTYARRLAGLRSRRVELDAVRAAAAVMEYAS
jgi:hypothetical protein